MTKKLIKIAMKDVSNISKEFDLTVPIALHPDLEKDLLGIDGIQKNFYGLQEPHVSAHNTRIILQKEKGFKWEGENSLLQRVQQVIRNYFEKQPVVEFI